MNKTILGNTEFVEISGRKGKKIPAKIDTGADSSAIWASKIRVDKDGTLKFALFGEGSEFYNGKIFKRTDFSVVKVRSTTGHEQIRYRVPFSVIIGGKVINMKINLSDRSGNIFPILIGRTSLSGEFIVDPSIEKVKIERKKNRLNRNMKISPYEFYKKYIKGAEK